MRDVLFEAGIVQQDVNSNGKAVSTDIVRVTPVSNLSGFHRLKPGERAKMLVELLQLNGPEAGLLFSSDAPAMAHKADTKGACKPCICDAMLPEQKLDCLVENVVGSVK